MLVGRYRSLVHRQHRVCAHEKPRVQHGHHRPDQNSAHLVAKLDRAVGAQTPARGTVLLHVGGDATGHQQHGGRDHSDARIAQSERGVNRDEHHHSRGKDVRIVCRRRHHEEALTDRHHGRRRRGDGEEQAAGRR